MTNKFISNEANSKPADDSSTYGTMLTSVQAAVVATEVTPVNEAIRLFAAGAAIAKGWDPEAVGAVIGGTTFVIEASAAAAAAGLMTHERGERVVKSIKQKMEDRGVSPEARFSRLAKSAIAFLGGSAISVAVEKIERPDMTSPELRRYGVKTAGYLAGVTAVQGYLVARGINTPDIETIGTATAAIAGTVGVRKWGSNKIRKEEEDHGVVHG